MNIKHVLTRGVAKIYPSMDDLKKLLKKRKITLYQGFDPTGDSLHIGHIVGARKLAQFQKLGHKIIFLIGDFTARIGDPTDKGAARRRLSKKEVKENLKNYKNQVKRIIDFDGDNPAEVRFNGDWLSKLSFEEIVEIASNFTAQQMIERSMFQDRIKNEKPIFLHEFLYPLMQGYDSVKMGVDLEIGATDQIFNMLVGRTLAKKMKNKEKMVLAMKLLEAPGGKKMGKSEGNAVNLAESPENLFGQVMSLPDEFVDLGIELLTDLPLDHQKQVGPMQAKKDWAFEVVRQLHGREKATVARKSFKSIKDRSKDDHKTKLPNRGTFSETVSHTSGVSISQIKNVIKQGGAMLNGLTVVDHKIKVKTGDKIKYGKHLFGVVTKKDD